MVVPQKINLCILCWLWIAAAPLHGQTVGEGIVAVEAGRLDDAVRILSDVVRRNPNYSEGYSNNTRSRIAPRFYFD